MNSVTFRISTITANGDVGTKVDLNAFYDHLNLVDQPSKGFIWAKYNKQVKGVHPDPKKNAADYSEVKHFNHQVTVVYNMGQKYNPNLKLFYTGNVQMTGVKSLDDVKYMVDRIVDELKRIHNMGIKVVDDIDKLESKNFAIRMINSDFRVPYEIRRKELYTILLEHYDNSCSYQPESYPGVKMYFYWNRDHHDQNGVCTCDNFCIGKGEGKGDGACKKVTISIFRSGSILITGATSYEQVSDVYMYINSILKKYEHQIRWTSPMAPAPTPLLVKPSTKPKSKRATKVTA